MARKMRKFSAGGAQGKYDRRMADIKKDFEKDSAGKSGKALEVLTAKRAQRTADAEDDRAKRMGTDRTATRKAEYDAEKNLSRTRKFGADKPVAAAEPAKASAPVATATPEVAKAKLQSFSEAFKAARDKGEKTFSWAGKPGTTFTTKMAGEGAKKATRSGTSSGSSTPKATTTTPRPAATTTTPRPAATTTTPRPAATTTTTTSKPSLLDMSKNPAALKEAKERAADAAARGSVRKSISEFFTGSDEARARYAAKQAAARKNMENAGRAKDTYKPGPQKVDWSKATVKKAKGGSIDGIAQRGKTRASLKKGK